MRQHQDSREALPAAKEQGVILDVAFDNNGDLDRDSFLVEVRNGKQEMKEILPALSRK